MFRLNVNMQLLDLEMRLLMKQKQSERNALKILDT